MLMFLPKGVDTFDIHELPHPKTGKPSEYLFANKDCYEMQRHSDNSSCFLDNRVIENGDFVLASRVDPLYIVLSALRKSATRNFSTRDDLLPVSLVPLFPCFSDKDLSNICDVREIDGEEDKFFRLNDAKTIQWLQKKSKQVDQFIRKRFKAAEAAGGGMDLDHDYKLGLDSESGKIEIIGILSEYLSSDMRRELCKSYGVDSAKKTSAKKRKKRCVTPKGLFDNIDLPCLKKQKLETKENKVRRVKPLSKAAARLKKVNTKGMKSIFALWGK